ACRSGQSYGKVTEKLRSTEANLKKEDELLRLEEKLRVEKLRSTEANAKNGDLKARIDNQTRGIDIEKLMKEQDRAQGLDHVPINIKPKIKDGWITKDLFYFCIEYYNYSILLLL
ncbi:Uncharacterized protein APZ42_003934, partial [Daphnia magna]